MPGDKQRVPGAESSAVCSSSSTDHSSHTTLDPASLVPTSEASQTGRAQSFPNGLEDLQITLISSSPCVTGPLRSVCMADTEKQGPLQMQTPNLPFSCTFGYIKRIFKPGTLEMSPQEHSGAPCSGPTAAGKVPAPPPFCLCSQEVPPPEEATALGLIWVN